jgi:type I restriction enzyme R subunit
MPALNPEQRARQQIDAQLAACGWEVQDYNSVDLSTRRGIALVRFALDQQPVLAHFADSVSERFHEWLMDKQGGSGVPPLNQEGQSRDGSATFTPEQLAWLGLIRDHIATSLSIDPEDFKYTPFGERGGLGKAHQIFWDGLNRILAELNLKFVA